jgi:hypothetical protein
MYKLLGIFLSFYVVYGLLNGRIFGFVNDRACGRFHAEGRMLYRGKDSWLYWTTLVVYSVLAFALILFFGSREPFRT